MLSLPSTSFRAVVSPGFFPVGAGDVCLVLVLLLGGSVLVSSLPVLLEGLRWFGIGGLLITGLAIARGVRSEGAGFVVGALVLAVLPVLTGPAPTAMVLFVPLVVGAVLVTVAPWAVRRVSLAQRRRGQRPVPAGAMGIVVAALSVAMIALA